MNLPNRLRARFLENKAHELRGYAADAYKHQNYLTAARYRDQAERLEGDARELRGLTRELPIMLRQQTD